MRNRGFDLGQSAEQEVLRWAQATDHPQAQLVDSDDPGTRWRYDIYDPADRAFTVEVKHDQLVSQTDKVCLELLGKDDRVGALLWSRARFLAYKLGDQEGFYLMPRARLVEWVFTVGHHPPYTELVRKPDVLIMLVHQGLFRGLPFTTLIR